jgi:hypothetical protein
MIELITEESIMLFLKVLGVSIAASVCYFVGALIHYIIGVFVSHPRPDVLSENIWSYPSVFQKPYHKNFIRWLSKNDGSDVMVNILLGMVTSINIVIMTIFPAPALSVLIACGMVFCLYIIIRNYADKFENEVNGE